MIRVEEAFKGAVTGMQDAVLQQGLALIVGAQLGPLPFRGFQVGARSVGKARLIYGLWLGDKD